MDSETWFRPTLQLLIYWTFLLVAKDHSSRAAALTRSIGLNTSVGKQVTLQCNSTYLQKINQITWWKDYFGNKTLLVSCRSNCSYGANMTERIKADPADPAKLQIIDVQLSDEGDYICEVTSTQGNFNTIWHLIVEENNDLAENSDLFYIPVFPALLVVCMFCIAMYYKSKHCNG
ncbi:cell surface glycoprotein CD200 receptor 1-like [Huso huso]|uniref:Cell surface glycoprotein CD200 receptor 1-like n=1 Tax=Huso huso TaxID=61971 RepID=A0ABR0ZQB8_HUSHU